ncbi:MAG: efflux RND transporter periplasmic adaptor subunit [Gemmatimonadaceae bacterium]|nr:efflux RND transporter periplasmic adaptor subunit [Gemmatimonadaceae bacterium]
MQSKQSFSRAILVVPALGAAFAVAACSKAPQRPAHTPVTVSVVAARRADIPYIVQANGIVTPIQTANVAPQVSGIVTRVAFQEGQEVTKGQVLFQIDPVPYQATYQQTLATFERDSATAANARSERDRYRKLVAMGVITEEEADQYETTAATTAASMRADAAQVASAKFNLDNTTVRAPISGKTGSVLVRVGNLVSAAGGQPLVVINQVRPITVRFSLPSSELPKLQRYALKGGLPVTALPGGGTAGAAPFDTTTTASPMDESSPVADALAAQQGADVRPETGELTFIDNAVDTTTGTVQLKATFANRDEALWVGQFASASMRLYVERGALVVPAQAIQSGQQGTYVYTLDADNKAQQHPVVVERTASGLAVIAAGLAEGDRVVTEGQSRLTPGAVATLRSASDTGAMTAKRGQRGGAGGAGGVGGSSAARGGATGG